jgi:hypothetical protein
MLAQVVSPPAGESMVQLDTEATCETPADANKRLRAPLEVRPAATYKKS